MGQIAVTLNSYTLNMTKLLNRKQQSNSRNRNVMFMLHRLKQHQMSFLKLHRSMQLRSQLSTYIDLCNSDLNLLKVT